MIKYTEQDSSIAQSVMLKLGEFEPVEFQFPPKLLSDNRRGSWQEDELPGTEPVANYKTSGAREMPLSFTYIVDSYTSPTGPGIGSGSWTVARIKDQLQKLRGYFTALRTIDADRNGYLVLFSYPWLTGITTYSCRLRGVDVKHGETLVGSGRNVFPLRTDVVCDLRLWTTGVVNEDGSAGANGKKVQDFRGLMPEPEYKDLWY